MPSAGAWLPTEKIAMEQSNADIPRVSVSSVSSADVGPFGRTAQAVWLLDQVLQSIEPANCDFKVHRLQKLDGTLQSFLGTIMLQLNGKKGALCEAVAIVIRSVHSWMIECCTNRHRALFMLHGHTIAQSTQRGSFGHASLAEWAVYSHAALESITKIILDIVKAHENSDSRLSICFPPAYPYILHVALKYLEVRVEINGYSWLTTAKARIRVALDQTGQRWNGNEVAEPREGNVD